jgi:hypothetical protein
MISLAAQLPNPDHALQLLLPSLWLFLVGILSAGVSILLLSKQLHEKAEHFAQAHNRDQVKAAIDKTVEIVASPAHLAEGANAGRNRLIEEYATCDSRAEAAWDRPTRWARAWIASAVLSSSCFVGGIGWPLVQVSFGTTLVP